MFNSVQFMKFLTFTLLNGVAMTLPSAFTDEVIIRSSIWFSIMLVSNSLYFILSPEPCGMVIMILTGFVGAVGLILSGFGSVGLTALWYCGLLFLTCSFPWSCVFGLLHTRDNRGINRGRDQNAAQAVGNYPYVITLEFDLGVFVVFCGAAYNMVGLWSLSVPDRLCIIMGLVMLGIEGLVCVLCAIYLFVLVRRLNASAGRVSPTTLP